jgi:hypothetical protein
MGKQQHPIALEVDYQSLGTISLEEFKHALWEDIQALHDEFDVSFVKNAKLIVPSTNEFGDPVDVHRRSNGHRIKRIDTHHYHPACLDYKL